MDCKRKGYSANHSIIKKPQEMADRHEDIEDLIRFGATFEEIVQRSGYANWTQMRRSLQGAGKTDVLERLRQRRGAVPNTVTVRDKGNKKKQGRRMYRQGDVHDFPKGVELY